MRRPRLAFERLAFAHSDVSELGNLFHVTFADHRNVYCLIDSRLAAFAIGIIQALASHSNRSGIAIATAGGDSVLVFRDAFVPSLHALRFVADVQLADFSFIFWLRYRWFYWLTHCAADAWLWIWPNESMRTWRADCRFLFYLTGFIIIEAVIVNHFTINCDTWSVSPNITLVVVFSLVESVFVHANRTNRAARAWS